METLYRKGVTVITKRNGEAFYTPYAIYRKVVFGFIPSYTKYVLDEHLEYVGYEQGYKRTHTLTKRKNRAEVFEDKEKATSALEEAIKIHEKALKHSFENETLSVKNEIL